MRGGFVYFVEEWFYGAIPWIGRSRTVRTKGQRFSWWATFLVATLIMSAWSLSTEVHAAEPVSAELEDVPPFSLIVLARRLIGAAGSVTALDLKSLEAAGATTVGDALRLSPEVLILRYGRGGAIESIGIKGMGAAQAAIFLDGAPVPAKGAATLLDVPLAGIERIEIVKDDPAALGNGGAIHLVTKGASRLEASYAGSSSRFPHRDIVATDSGAIGEARYFASVAHTAEPALPGQNDRQRYVSFRLQRELPTSSSQLAAGFTWTLTEWGAPLMDESPAPLAEGYRDLAAGDVTWMRELAAGIVEARGYAQRIRELNEPLVDSPPQDDVTLGGEIRATLETGAGEAVVGAAARRESDDVRSTFAASLFAKLSRPFGDFAQASVGGQFNLLPHLGPAFSPSVQISVLPFPQTTARASIAHAVRPVALEELQAHDGKADPLRPQSAWRYELGLSHQLSWGLIDVDVFREHASDRIYWLPDGNGVRRPQNLDETVTQGVDVTASAPLSSALTSFVGWRWTSDKDAVTGESLPLVPEHELRWGIRYQGQATRGNFELRFLGPRSNGTGATLPATALASGRIVHAAGRNLDLFAEGHNLFDVQEDGEQHGASSGRKLMIGASWAF